MLEREIGMELGLPLYYSTPKMRPDYYYYSTATKVSLKIMTWSLGFQMVFPGFMKVPLLPLGFMPS